MKQFNAKYSTMLVDIKSIEYDPYQMAVITTSANKVRIEALTRFMTENGEMPQSRILVSRTDNPEVFALENGAEYLQAALNANAINPRIEMACAIICKDKAAAEELMNAL